MIKLLPILPIAAALSLIACQNDGPVAEGAETPPEEMLGDRASAGIAAPANAGEAEALDRASLPPATDGMEWAVGAGRADFGPPGSDSILTFACAPGGLTVTRHHPASPGSKATLSLTGSGHVASVPVETIATSGGPGRAEWQGKPRGDMARAVARSFSRTGQVEISLGGTPSLVVPADPRVRQLFADCLSG